jgi:WD40 repeat protein/transcriptional regulator with XRE-family HTH domain
VAKDDPHNAEKADETPEARFGAELRRLRVHAGLSGRRLADELHRGQSSIVDYERGVRLPSVEVVEQYEDYFDLLRGTLLAQRERARVERLERPTDGTVDDDLGDAVCPYKGLREFEYDDAALFFGRESQIERVLARLAEARFVAVVGASGSGKSSFVRAGLLANIRATSANSGVAPRVALLTPGTHPVDELATSVSAAIGARGVLADELRGDPHRLRGAVDRGGDRGLVIVIDQFEELFTLCNEEAERRCFVGALIAAWRDYASPVVVIIALRADFYGRVTAYPELAAAVVAHQALIGPMSQTDLRRAIELPAAKTGLQLQPGLVETILEDLGDEPGALPLLSHALLETWQRRRRLMLTVSGYREAGGVRGAIAETAERTLHSLPEVDRSRARLVFLSVTDVSETSEPTRQRVDRAELAGRLPSDQVDRVLDVLAEARLVTLDERTVVVAHEALIRHWPRLRGWIDADRAGLLLHRRLTDAARQWDTLDRETAALYRGARLATAREWAIDHPDRLSQLERDFLTASQANEQTEEDAARRRARRLRGLVSGFGVLAVIVAALAVWALDQRSNAQWDRNTAQRQSARATSIALASSASALLNSRPDASLLLALEANRASARAEARSSALAALIAVSDPKVPPILDGHTNDVRGAAFSHDGRTLASVSDDGTVRLWNVAERQQLGAPLTGHANGYSGVAFSRDGRMLAFAVNNTVRLWDVRTRSALGQPLTGHTGDVYDVAFSPDGRTLASAADDKTIRLWNARSRRQLAAPLTGVGSIVLGVAFSPDGRTLASASDQAIELWDVRTRKRLGQPLGTNIQPGGGLAFSPDGRTLASAGFDNEIRLWNVRTHEQLGASLTGHTTLIADLAFSPDGRTLASASWDKTIRLWNARTHKRIGAPLVGHADEVTSVAFSPDGRTLASTSNDKTIRLWTLASRGERLGRPLRAHTDHVTSVAFGRDGTLASAGFDNTIRLWNMRTHKLLGRPLRGHTGTIHSVAFSPDGRTLASAGNDKTIRLWNVRSHKQLGAPLTGHINLVFGLAFSPDGRTLTSAGDNTVRLWDVRTHKQRGAPLNPRTGGIDSLTDVAFSPDGRTVAATTDEQTTRLWDVRTRKQLGRPLTGPVVGRVAFSPDARTLAAGIDDKTIRMWDVRTGRQLGPPLTGHTEYVKSVAFSPNGRTLASASDDESVRLWDVRTHKPLGLPLVGQSTFVYSLAFSPDGRTLASAEHATIWLWKRIIWHSFAELQAKVCKLVGSGLSKTEWAQYANGIPYRQSCP